MALHFPEGAQWKGTSDGEATIQRTAAAREAPHTSQRHAVVHWVLAVQGTSGATYIDLVTLSSHHNGETAFRRIKEKYDLIAGSTWRERWLSSVYTGVIVGTAEIERVSEMNSTTWFPRLTSFWTDIREPHELTGLSTRIPKRRKR